MYTIYVKFECLPQKREAFINKVKKTGILEAWKDGKKIGEIVTMGDMITKQSKK